MNCLTDNEQVLLSRLTTERAYLTPENKRAYSALETKRNIALAEIRRAYAVVKTYRKKCPDIFGIDNQFDFHKAAEAQQRLELNLKLDLRIQKRNLKYSLRDAMLYIKNGEFPHNNHAKMAVKLLKRIENCEQVLRDTQTAHPNWFFEENGCWKLQQHIKSLESNNRILEKTENHFRILESGGNIPDPFGEDHKPYYHNIDCMVCKLPIYVERSLRFRLHGVRKSDMEKARKWYVVECPRCHCERAYFKG